MEGRLREYAIDLLDDVPENKWDCVIGYLEGITTLPRDEDPFFSETNQRHLKRAIANLEAGLGKEHDLIEM